MAYGSQHISGELVTSLNLVDLLDTVVMIQDDHANLTEIRSRYYIASIARFYCFTAYTVDIV